MIFRGNYLILSTGAILSGSKIHAIHFDWDLTFEPCHESCNKHAIRYVVGGEIPSWRTKRDIYRSEEGMRSCRWAAQVSFAWLYYRIYDKSKTITGLITGGSGTNDDSVCERVFISRRYDICDASETTRRCVEGYLFSNRHHGKIICEIFIIEDSLFLTQLSVFFR